MSPSLRVVCQGEWGACAHGAGRLMFPDADAPGAIREDDTDNATLFYVVARKLRFNPPQEKRSSYGFSRLMRQERLRRAFKPEELALLFQDDDLARRFEARKSAIGLDALLYAPEVDRERTSVLLEALTAKDGARLRHLGRLARQMGASEDVVRRAEAAETGAQTALRDAEPDSDGDLNVSAALRRSREVKSVLALRAKPSDPDGQALLRSLFESGGDEVSVRLISCCRRRAMQARVPASWSKPTASWQASTPRKSRLRLFFASRHATRTLVVAPDGRR